jgi:hypothetical protein
VVGQTEFEVYVLLYRAIAFSDIRNGFSGTGALKAVKDNGSLYSFNHRSEFCEGRATHYMSGVTILYF